MWLFALFIAIPLIEIALFIQVGGAIGLPWTLAIVVITAILGTWLVRNQGLQALGNLQNSFSQLSDPTEHLAHGAMILFSGALLLTPGFFTDTIGFLLLMPPVRLAIFRYLRSRVQVQQFTMGSAGPRRQHPAKDTVIEGEYTDITPPNGSKRGDSGWTRH